MRSGIQIKTIIDIAKEGGLELEQAGEEYAACCPKHGDQKASFFINPSKEMWICFGCSEGGGTIRLYQFLHNCDWATAVNEVAGDDAPTWWLEEALRQDEPEEDDVACFALACVLKVMRNQDIVPSGKLAEAVLGDNPGPAILGMLDTTQSSDA